MSGELNPPDLAEAINAKGFMGAAGFRIVAIKPGPRGAQRVAASDGPAAGG